MGFPDQPRDQDPPGTPGGYSGPPGAFGQDPGGYGDQVPGAGNGDQGPAAGYGYPPPSDYHPGYQNPASRTNGLAISALVLAILQFLLWFFLLFPGFIVAIVALILGVAALSQIRRTGEGGRGMAITGIVLGGLGVLGGIVWIIVFAVGSSHFHFHNPY